ncbi:hypothetical protein GCK72_017648 [Caenorhabditis remanei]|uniref:Uncharacterized protein n=2 Tax=Caenorhabditis TaxID=6237 RepID=A0A6A5G8D3_CAERE|nr:hypothetical protein GCK72_017648 [Caenorhabditis remanei]KAF1751096.1 hypothetical protein GCK72_017648 [Caenorhabditis remanei]
MEKCAKEELARISSYAERRSKWPLIMQAQMTTGPGCSTPGFYPQPRARDDSNIDDIPVNSTYLATVMRDRENIRSD